MECNIINIGSLFNEFPPAFLFLVVLHIVLFGKYSHLWSTMRFSWHFLKVRFPSVSMPISDQLWKMIHAFKASAEEASGSCLCCPPASVFILVTWSGGRVRSQGRRASGGSRWKIELSFLLGPSEVTTLWANFWEPALGRSQRVARPETPQCRAIQRTVIIPSCLQLIVYIGSFLNEDT